MIYETWCPAYFHQIERFIRQECQARFVFYMGQCELDRRYLCYVCRAPLEAPGEYPAFMATFGGVARNLKTYVCQDLVSCQYRLAVQT